MWAETVLVMMILGGIVFFCGSMYRSAVKKECAERVDIALKYFESLVVKDVDIEEARRLACRWTKLNVDEEAEFDRMVELKFEISWEALGVEVRTEEGKIIDAFIEKVRAHSRTPRGKGQ